MRREMRGWTSTKEYRRKEKRTQLHKKAQQIDKTIKEYKRKNKSTQLHNTAQNEIEVKARKPEGATEGTAEPAAVIHLSPSPPGK